MPVSNFNEAARSTCGFVMRRANCPLRVRVPKFAGCLNASATFISLLFSLHIYLTVIASRFLAFAATLRHTTGDRTMQEDFL
jgi:hypothetical protein